MVSNFASYRKLSQDELNKCLPARFFFRHTPFHFPIVRTLGRLSVHEWVGNRIIGPVRPLGRCIRPPQQHGRPVVTAMPMGGLRHRAA